MADIYGNEQTYRNTRFEKFDEVIVSVAGGDVSSNNMFQAVSLQYSTNIPIIREIGSKKYYHGKMPGQGMMQVQRFISDKSVYSVLPKTLFTALNTPGQTPPDISIKTIDGKVSFVLHGCIVTNYGITVQEGSPYIQESLSIVFTGLEEKGKS